MRRKARLLTVNLASNEYGNELMKQVADEHFAADPTLDVVEVHEHGGWMLAWNRAGVTVGTANNTARLMPAAIAWGEQFNGVEPVGWLRREAAPVAA